MRYNPEHLAEAGHQTVEVESRAERNLLPVHSFHPEPALRLAEEEIAVC